MKYCVKVSKTVFLKYECAYESLGNLVKIPSLLCEGMAVVANAMVVIISQYINVANQHFVHLKLTQYYVLIISW